MKDKTINTQVIASIAAAFIITILLIVSAAEKHYLGRPLEQTSIAKFILTTKKISEEINNKTKEIGIYEPSGPYQLWSSQHSSEDYTNNGSNQDDYSKQDHAQSYTQNASEDYEAATHDE